MIALQVLSKVIVSKDMAFLEDNVLTVDYFVGFVMMIFDYVIIIKKNTKIPVL